ncbi:hypothetical protein F511_03651 [Dorcoceras hygrometricum]|uniref:Uncharacterized protein n=1 Tax=Dorcoceras hygrometricum TaxID=472368 RepID=A0A2Z7BJR0_9LAMI|nr:hypothetical protein F511_03651 [Dorcoceras hygrometricum]
MSNITGDEGSFSSGEVQQSQEEKLLQQNQSFAPATTNSSNGSTSTAKKKRNLPGTPGKSHILKYGVFALTAEGDGVWIIKLI